MKKVLYLADAYKIDRHPLEFAGFVCHLMNATLTGLLLDPPPGQVVSEKALREEMICSGAAVNRDMSTEELKQHCIHHNKGVFRHTCEDLGVSEASVLVEDGMAEEVLLECRYADLLLIDPVLGLSAPPAGHWHAFVRNILSQAECPVILIPERFGGLEEIVFAYDASPSAVFAIKQCCALFPRLADRKVTVLTAHGEKRVSRKEVQKMATWLRENFQAVDFVNVGADSRKGLLEYVLGKDKLMVVMGAYGRSGWSSFFSTSHAEPLARYVSKALFVSHL